MSLQMAKWTVKTEKDGDIKNPGPVKFPGVLNNIYHFTTIRI